MPFTGWMCMKQDYTITLKNYGDGKTLTLQMVVRGCAPVQSYNPYDKTECYPMTETTNPYVRAVLSGLYFPEENVGPVEGNSGGYSGNSASSGSSSSTTNNLGEVCICYGSWCNHATAAQPNVRLMATLTFIFLAFFVMRFRK
jgi:hypothetical protein